MRRVVQNKSVPVAVSTRKRRVLWTGRGKCERHEVNPPSARSEFVSLVSLSESPRYPCTWTGTHSGTADVVTVPLPEVLSAALCNVTLTVFLANLFFFRGGICHHVWMTHTTTVTLPSAVYFPYIIRPLCSSCSPMFNSVTPFSTFVLSFFQVLFSLYCRAVCHTICTFKFKEVECFSRKNERTSLLGERVT